MKTNGSVAFWYADMGGVPPPRPSLNGNLRADVCIVGAGFTGLWTAYYLKKADPSLIIVVVERDFAGFGASGRNGGWLFGNFAWQRDRYLVGSSMDAVMAMGNYLRDAVREVIEVARQEGIDADILPGEYFRAVCNPAQLKRLGDYRDYLLRWGYKKSDVSIVDSQAARKRIDIAGVQAAMIVKGGARLQPAKLVRGLAEAVERLGVVIYEGTTVRRFGDGIVETDKGTVTADMVVRATEGFTRTLQGQERQIAPLSSVVLVTEKVPQDIWDRIGWNGNELLADGSHVYTYAQRTREGRIMIGGRGNYLFGSGIDSNGHVTEGEEALIRGNLSRLLPVTRDLRTEHVWKGVLGVPRDWCCSIGVDPSSRMAWAGGYVGTGVPTANLAGRTLSDLILRKKTPLTDLPWVNRRARVWEREPLRWAGIKGMHCLYSLADLAERRSGSSDTSKFAKLANSITGRK